LHEPRILHFSSLFYFFVNQILAYALYIAKDITDKIFLTLAQSIDESSQEVQPVSIEDFLQQIETRAYRMALLAVREHADAIDILQDAMFKLVEKYAEKPAEQWKPLFYRILQNRIHDWQRQQKMKRLLFFWKQDEDENPEQNWAAEPDLQCMPGRELEKQQQTESVLTLLGNLPEKQRQCFLLRSWEGLSVAETADIMGCSQGSVKTHYFRAVTKLRDALGEKHEVEI